MQKVLCIKNDIHELNTLTQFLEEVGDELGLSPGLVMNLNLVLEEAVSNIIFYAYPKDAVVERDGYHVIFLLKEDRAVWTYVDVVHSNIDSYAITGCQRKETVIQEGDVVITSYKDGYTKEYEEYIVKDGEVVVNMGAYSALVMETLKGN